MDGFGRRNPGSILARVDFSKIRPENWNLPQKQKNEKVKDSTERDFDIIKLDRMMNPGQSWRKKKKEKKLHHSWHVILKDMWF